MNNPVLYSKSANSTVTHAKQYLSDYNDLFKWSNSEDILEIGCSNGRVTKEALYPFVKDHLGHLIGADIFAPGIKAANETNRISNLSFQVIDVMDETKCGKYREKFDHIFAFYLLHVLKKPEVWSKNLYKMLKPNGQFFAMVALVPNLYTESIAAQRREKSKPWYKHIESLPDLFYDFGAKPIETVGGILKDAGFTIDAIDARVATFCFDTIDLVKGMYNGANSFLLHLPEELRDSYLNDFSDKILQHVTFEDGKYWNTMDILTLLVTKN